jgi:hypothetical protein
MPSPAGDDRHPAAKGTRPSYPMPLSIGQFRLDADDDTMVRETSSAPQRQAFEAHPIFGFIAALGGLGAPIETVFAQCGGSVQSGPLLASCSVRFSRPLQIGITYQVVGFIEAVTRKASRRFGAADHLRLNIDVRDGDIHYSNLHLTIVMPVETRHG